MEEIAQKTFRKRNNSILNSDNKILSPRSPIQRSEIQIQANKFPGLQQKGPLNLQDLGLGSDKKGLSASRATSIMQIKMTPGEGQPRDVFVSPRYDQPHSNLTDVKKKRYVSNNNYLDDL